MIQNFLVLVYMWFSLTFINYIYLFMPDIYSWKILICMRNLEQTGQAIYAKLTLWCLCLTIVAMETQQRLLCVWWGADKSLAIPGRKQATATKLGIYSTENPRSSVHLVARLSNFCTPLKKNSECCQSKQVSAAMTWASDQKWRPFNYFFSPGNRWWSDGE